MKSFDFEEERIISEINRLGAKRVLLQLPEGLKSEGPRLAELLEKRGVLPIISGDPCYGACDLVIFGVEHFQIDLIIHFGHTRMIQNEEIPTIYVDVRSSEKINKVIAASISLIKKYQKIGLVTTIQHVHTLKTAQELLVNAGKTVLIGNANKMLCSGQIIGCNYNNVKSIAKEVDAFIFIGGGKFHALGVALNTNKPTILANPFSEEALLMDNQVRKLLQKHWISIEKAKNAKIFGIFVGLKPGQENFSVALEIKRLIEKLGKYAVIILLNEILPETLMEFPTIDAYVNTACPRLSFDAPLKFLKPVLTINEFKVLSGEFSWKDMIKRGLFEK
jgi:2-(3-amino-3-carboxypropyl)histidine synthase